MTLSRQNIAFLAELLDTMIFPGGASAGKSIAPQPFRRKVLSSALAGEQYVLEHPGEPVPASVSQRGFAEDEVFGKLCTEKLGGLQAGALMYALYWIPFKLGPEYATAENAARVVDETLLHDGAPFSRLLANLKKYDRIAHYWAAFFITVYPVNRYWNQELFAEDETELHTTGEKVAVKADQATLQSEGRVGEPEQDSLYDFMQRVDLPTFLGHAESFLWFRKAYMRPTRTKSERLPERNDYIWLEQERAGCESIHGLPVPDLWPDGYSFEKVKKACDDARLQGKIKSARHYLSKYD